MTDTVYPSVLPISPWSPPELLAEAVPEDEREWVPSVVPNVWMRPLLFDPTNGFWVNITRMRTEGIVSRHVHPAPVHGYVLKGQWRYLERDWVATEGSYLFEPAGDVHTLYALPGESLTMFHISATLIELDESGKPSGFADVFTRIQQAAAHYESVGLGADYVKKYIR
jgi:2,4'-dihydroxyacetophenone dioxygenase